MIPVYLHEYTFSSMDRQNPEGVISIVISIRNTEENQDEFDAIDKLKEFLTGTDLYVRHKLLLAGYKQEL
jgi:hypothetical protein